MFFPGHLKKKLALQKFERVVAERLVCYPEELSDETPSATLWYSNMENNPIYPICS